jgi:hypothetical protein
MNLRIILLLLVYLQFSLSAQIPALLDPSFKLPNSGVSIILPTPTYVEGARKHYDLPTYKQNVTAKPEPTIELHLVGGYSGGRLSYYFDLNDTTKLRISTSVKPAEEVRAAASPVRLKKLLDQLVTKLRAVSKSGIQPTTKFVGAADVPDLIMFTHHLLTPDRILIQRGSTEAEHELWSDLFAEILGSTKDP